MKIIDQSYSAVNVNRSRSKLTGFFFVDIDNYDNQIHQYLQIHGAVRFDGLIPISTISEIFESLHYKNCKPVRFFSFDASSGARIFFPDKDEALIFSVAYGERIFSSNIKEINSLLKKTS